MSEQEKYQSRGFELSLAGYEVRGGAIGHGPAGTTFAFSFGPIASDTLALLEEAVRRGRRCKVLLPEPLLLEGVTLIHEGERRLRLTGRIVGDSLPTVDMTLR